MEFLGVGPLELFFIILIALIVLGPKDMVKAGQTIGQFLRKLITSSSWRTIREASEEIRTIPNRLMREAGIQEIRKEFDDIKNIGQEIGGELKGDLKEIQTNLNDINDLTEWTTPPLPSPSPRITETTPKIQDDLELADGNSISKDDLA
jgi:Sec-independent protein translocase protein TatA